MLGVRAWCRVSPRKPPAMGPPARNRQHAAPRPVQALTVHPVVWKAALMLLGPNGDPHRLRIVNANTVTILTRPPC